jgi:hypothetical protein
MITAKQLRKQAEKNKKERCKKLNNDLQVFFDLTEEKLLKAAERGETRIMLRLPFDFLEMDSDYLEDEIVRFYTHYGYKVSFPRRYGYDRIQSVRVYFVSWGCD